VSRFPQGPAEKGSQKLIQKLVNESPDLLNSPIRTQLNLPETEKITWLSPIADDAYAEYKDQARHTEAGKPSWTCWVLSLPKYPFLISGLRDVLSGMGWVNVKPKRCSLLISVEDFLGKWRP
jgi:hypothetical protein